jgi:hypothetical protein
MKALPKLMKNSTLTIDIVSEVMPEFSVCIHGATSWPSVVRLDENGKMLRFFDMNGTLVHEEPPTVNLRDLMPNFGLIFTGVTESTVDFKSKSQFIAAKMRTIDLDAEENVHGDNWDFYE